MGGITGIEPYWEDDPPVEQILAGLSVTVDGQGGADIHVSVVNTTDEDISATLTIMPIPSPLQTPLLRMREIPKKVTVFVWPDKPRDLSFFELAPGVYNVFLEVDDANYEVGTGIVVGGGLL
jgi:hypothetical protein